MQTLYFEPAWDKTIAPEDRAHIQQVFQKQSEQLGPGVHFSFLRSAINHRGERLIMVLIHNRTETPLQINQAVVTYEDAGQTSFVGEFNVPCVIDHYTSMPWTFIFNTYNSTTQQPDYYIL